MKTVTLRLPDALHAKLTSLARKRNVTRTDVVREALENFLANGINSRELTAYDLTSDLCGSVEGPGDLATNPKYMEGYGE